MQNQVATVPRTLVLLHDTILYNKLLGSLKSAGSQLSAANDLDQSYDFLSNTQS